MRDHGRIEELMALAALDGLDREDAELLARERAEHGPGCEGCVRLEREMAEVAGRLATALEPVPVREGLEDEVVARALGRDRTPSRGGVAVLRRISMLAAAAALLVGGWVLRDLTLPSEPEGPSPAFLAEATILRFEGPGEGSLSVAFKPDEAGAFVLGTGLPEPATGEAYELWLFEGEQPVRAGCFVPADGTVLAQVQADVSSADLLAVTVEAEACPDAPTTEPIFIAEPA